MRHGPLHGAVQQRFGEDQYIAGAHRRLVHIIRGALEAADVVRQKLRVVGFVTAGHAGKTSRTRGRIRQVPGCDGQAVAHLAVAVLIPVVRKLERAAMEIAAARPVLHENTIVMIHSRALAKQFDETREHRVVVHQIDEGLAPRRHEFRAAKRSVVRLFRPRLVCEIRV